MQFRFSINGIQLCCLYFRKISILMKIGHIIIIALCDGMLHLIDNQSIHFNLQNYDPNVDSLLIICTRYYSQKRFILVFY